MANEDLKLNKVNLVSTQTVTTPVSSTTVSSQGGVDNVFKSFEEFAKKQGVTLKKEDLFSSQNRDEIIKLAEEYIKNADEKQFKELVDLIKKLPPEQQKEIIEKFIKINPKFSNVLSQGESKEVSDSGKSQPTENPSAKEEAIKTSIQSLFAHGFGSALTTETTALTQSTQQTQQAEEPSFAERLSSQKGLFNKAKTIIKERASSLNDLISGDIGVKEFATRNFQTTKAVVRDASQSLSNLGDSVAAEVSVRESAGARRARRDAEAGARYDTRTYSHSGAKNMHQQYIDEYAKNLYIYGEPKHTPEEWANLSDQEKAQFIKDNNVESLANSSLSDAKQSFGSFGINIKSNEALLQMKMMELQAANENGLTVAEFNKKPEMEQCLIIIDMAAEKAKTSPDKLTETEKAALEIANTVRTGILDKFKEALKASGQEEYIDKLDSMSFSEIFGLVVKTGNANKLATWLKESLNAKDENSLTEYEYLTKEILNKIPEYLMEKFASRAGQPCAMDAEIMNNPEFEPRFQNASAAEQSKIRAEYFHKKVGDNPEAYNKAIQDAIERGNIIDAKELLKLVQNKDTDMKKCREAYLKFTEQNADMWAAGKSIEIDLEPRQEAQFVMQGDKHIEDAAHRGRISHAQAEADMLKNREETSAEGKTCLTEDMDKMSGTARKLTINCVSASAENGELNEEQMNRIGTNIGNCTSMSPDEKVHAYNKISANENISSGRRAAFQNAVARADRTGSFARMGVDNHFVRTLDAEHQQESYRIHHESIQSYLPKSEAIKYQNKLADQIAECDVSNQAALHQIATSSIYEEVAIHAASNIHNYDASVQAKALEISYSTGNEKVIEAATLQVSQMAESAVNAVKDKVFVQLKAMEEKYSAAMIDELALRQLKKELGFEADTSAPEFKSKLQAYIAELKKLPKSELYRRLCNDMQSWPSDMQTMFLESIVKYCPELFAMMLDKFGTKLLTNFGQLNIATKNAVLMQMLKTPTKRSDAIAYMKANPNGNYSDDLKKLFDEIMEDLVSSGMIVDDDISEKLEEQRFEAEHPNYSIQTSLPDIGYKYNWNMISDIDGNIGLVS